jgi:hypothetical protein
MALPSFCGFDTPSLPAQGGQRRPPISTSYGTSPTAEDVSVTIQGTTLTFTDSALRNFPLEFNPHQDGSFSDTYVDAGGRSVTIQGRITGDVIDADVTNPPCEHHWHLKKEAPSR